MIRICHNRDCLLSRRERKRSRSRSQSHSLLPRRTERNLTEDGRWNIHDLVQVILSKVKLTAFAITEAADTRFTVTQLRDSRSRNSHLRDSRTRNSRSSQSRSRLKHLSRTRYIPLATNAAHGPFTQFIEIDSSF